MEKLENVHRCECGSAVFFDWGIEILTKENSASVRGGVIDSYRDYATRNAVKVCTRCNTPYVIEMGTIVDVSSELGPEEIQNLIRLGNATLPHVRVKDA